jgi:hypothetical protein
MNEPCKRRNGTYRAYFTSREEAEAFANNQANWPVYKTDVAHLCERCGFYHLSRLEWLFPEWNTLEENATVN